MRRVPPEFVFFDVPDRSVTALFAEALSFILGEPAVFPAVLFADFGDPAVLAASGFAVPVFVELVFVVVFVPFADAIICFLPSCSCAYPNYKKAVCKHYAI